MTTPVPALVRTLRGRWLTLLIAVAAVLPYLPTLGYELLRYDDPLFITRQPYWERPSLEAALEVLRRPIWGSYHPLHELSYLVDRLVWGPRALGVRVGQLVAYAACAALVHVVARRLRLAPAAAAVAALLFAWHPVHVENVAWAAQRKDLLSCAFTLAALAVYLGPRGAGPAGARAWAGVVVLFGLGLLSKSTTVVLIPAVALLVVADGRVRRDAAGLGVLLALGAGMARVHYLAQASVGATRPTVGLADRARNVTAATAHYVATVVAPLDLSLSSPPAPTRVTPAILALALVVPALAAVWWVRGARRRAALALWFLAALAPTSGLVPLPTFAQDRYLLIPSAAIALVVGDLVPRLAARAGRRFALALAGVGLVLLARTTAAYVVAWRDDVSVWRWAVETRPWDLHASTNYGGALFEAGRSAEAERVLRDVLVRSPGLPEAAMSLGVLLLDRDRPAARACFEQALRQTGPQAYTAALRVVAVDLDEGELDRAARDLERARALAPRWAPDVVASEARLDLLRGDVARAAARLRSALEQAPGWSEAWVRLGEAERLAGDPAAARAAADLGDPEGARVLRAHLALDAGRPDEAAARLEGAPRELEAELARVRLLLARGDAAGARRRLAEDIAGLGGGARLRAALEPDLRPLVSPPPRPTR
jgi:tetratricopeptide (TPR) repeat protein